MTSSRTVLHVAFHFPPIGGAGAQRVVQLVRHLPDHGYRSVVLTGPAAPDYRWTPADASLGDGEAAEVHRLAGTEPRHGVGWEARFERWARLPARWQRWWATSLVERASELGEDVDVVRASLAPYALGPAIVEVARRLGKPLVLDLEDPWALDEMMVYPTRLHRHLELRRMRRVLGSADAIVMNTSEAAGRVVSAFPELAPRVRAIPNAFEPADFAETAPPVAQDRFRIVHTGSLHYDAGVRHREASRLRDVLGGAVAGVDFLTRSHVVLLDALERLFARRPRLRELIELHFAGVLTEAEQASLGERSNVVLHGFVPHDRTITLIRSADLLFLPMHDLPAGRRAMIVPQKTYEYVASGRPILAAVPDGDARDLLQAAGTAALCRPADAPGMAAIIEEQIDRAKAGAQPPEPRPEVVERYGAPRLAAEVAGVLDDVVRGRAR